VCISEEITNNRFKISGSPGIKVSWQVTGIRHDAMARANPIVVEEDKPPHERGRYQNPEAHGQSEESGIDWPRNAERRRQIEQLRHARSIIPERPVFPQIP
jgi:trimeric autotransporter adhesin